jgi:hypothetical protein
MKAIAILIAALALSACASAPGERLAQTAEVRALSGKTITACVVRRDAAGLWLDIYADYGERPAESIPVRP